MMGGRFIFNDPEFLWLLLLLLPYLVWYILKQKISTASLQISSLKGFEQAPKSFKYVLRHFLFAFKMLALAALIVALARPQTTNSWQNQVTEGIDIMMALDISGSMLAEDFKPNRLEAAKDVAANFINDRPNDKIGLVIFAAESFTQCPLTTDHTVLLNLFQNIESGMLRDGTAIGQGLATSVARLKDSETKSKIVILLTDGVNNQGEIAPVTAAEIAKTFGIRVYTVGVGTMGYAPYPVKTAFGTQYQKMEVKIDEPTLRQIANLTDGAYFRATDKEKLEEIYREIDALEKTKIEVREYSKREEKFLWFAIPAIILLGLDFILRLTVLRSIP